MEKIYMEDNQNNGKKRRNLQTNTSIMMSFVLAFVAIVSIMAYGFGQTSFAIPDESVSPFPDTIHTGDESDNKEVVVGQSSTNFQIRLHQATINDRLQYVICIEKDVSISSNADYKKDKEITDRGLLFILKYLLSSDTTVVDGKGTTINEKAKGWIAQTLVWIYQKQVNAPNNSITDDQINLVKNEKKLTTFDDAVTFLNPILDTSANGTIYDVCKIRNSSLGTEMSINEFLAKALNIHNGSDSWYAFDLNISKRSDTVSVTSDNKYYQSDIITVTGTDNIEGYKVEIKQAPEGTIIVSEDGTELSAEQLDNLTAGTQFYVRVPVNKLTDENKTINIQVTAAFTGDIAYQYVADQSQTIAYTGKVTKHVSKGIDLNFDYTPEVPDTGITAAQSVYFIGLIILLAGVGIIYANIKPSKAE